MAYSSQSLSVYPDQVKLVAITYEALGSPPHTFNFLIQAPMLNAITVATQTRTLSRDDVEHE